MSKCFQLMAGFCCLGGLVLAVLSLNPVGSFLFRFRGSSAETLSLAEELGHREYLDQIDDALRRRRESKWHMAEQVVAGRLSLAEAMERFNALDREWPPGRLRLPETLKMSDEEWDGWGVLHYVKFVLQSRHEDTVAVLSRLKKELRELLAAPGEPRTEEAR
jgi:hypothetical protein